MLRLSYEPGRPTVRRRTIEVVVAGARNASSLLACAKEMIDSRAHLASVQRTRVHFAAIYGVLYSRTLRITWGGCTSRNSRLKIDQSALLAYLLLHSSSHPEYWLSSDATMTLQSLKAVLKNLDFLFSSNPEQLRYILEPPP